MQQQAKNLHAVAAQGELPLIKAPRPQPVSDDVIRACKTLLDAINLQINVSGQDEKDLYLSLKIESSHWSRMRKGEVHFPTNKLEQLGELCGNDIVLTWWAWRRGKGLHLLLSEAERQLLIERARADKAEERLQYLEGLVTAKP
jgi:hypothetical protein